MVGWHHQLTGHGKSGMLQCMGLQRVRHDLMTEQQQDVFNISSVKKIRVSPHTSEF